MPDSASRTGGSTRLEDLANDLRRKRSELEDQRKEIGGLIKQTSAEFDRAAQRTREAVGQLRTVESNLGAFSHADVKRAYSGAHEAQMRQFMMQTQLEQFRNRQTGLDATDELLRQLIDTADEMAEASASADEG